MIDTILELIKQNPDIFAYNIKTTTTNSHELHLIKQKINLNRAISSLEYEITIFTKAKINGKNKIGRASFKLTNNYTPDEIEEKINRNVVLSRSSLEDEYILPKKRTVKPIIKEASFDGHSLMSASFIVADALYEADKFEKSLINYAEITISFIEEVFIDSNENNFVNSRQVGNVYIVASAIDSEKDEQRDISGEFSFSTLNQADITKKTQDVLLLAYDKAKASKMPPVSNCKLVIQDKYAYKFFNFFANLAKNDNIYLDNLKYNIGSVIQKGYLNRNDLITLRFEPTLIDSTKNSFFDKDGVVLKRVNVIERGVIKNLWGSNMYSQLLHHQVNGLFENMIVNPGSLTKDDLEQDNYLELIEASNFDIDPITGNFNFEIVLANLYIKGKPKQPVYSGIVSGSIFASLESVRFSKDVIRLNNYSGPKKILLEKVSIDRGE